MIGIINYRCGNLQNLQNALDFLGHPSRLLENPEQMQGIQKLILPGVGAFRHAANNLKEFGFWEPLLKAFAAKTPILGICVGMQLLFSKSYEDGENEGLGLIEGEVVRFDHDLKVPHMGWNRVEFHQEDPLFEGIAKENWFYFVHSYACYPKDQQYLLGGAFYGHEFCAATRRDNLWGVQFHPEKSQEDGLRLLNNFAKVNPC
ncbi:MAG: imidazole glycerol phosphate synthase, glutamine amidotransferase subunit [Candidatus Lambdaproteobacteria bacterium RIFOXYD2_FULL_50_16]|uniref:Imidazole glycerol phosphate synthase subunit HisH n=1 Tax=Candidatus Lambdaproteobacteria bacterium RIFOXYD2_FULL_50_16 TaxID=1817772 RepID=A0A1F6GBJ7_9PROT|nr:MAG: imidazole glycerol phosphate synthase, glutamine amidotransferase subunit [Candidatus Lambdaproteobacteria bacterium RIFOXYD2_FULL_50_16]